MSLNETYSKIHIAKHLSDKFPIQNVLKQDAFSPLLFNCALEYAITMVQEDQVRLKLNRTHQLLVYADDGNLLGDNIKKNTETVSGASKEVCKEANTEKTKSHYQNAEQGHNIKTANRYSENLAKFKYVGMTVTNSNLIHEEIQSKLNSGNAFYHSVQNHQSSCLLSINVKMKIYRTIILPVSLH
jgi:hypothetical protein